MNFLSLCFLLGCYKLISQFLILWLNDAAFCFCFRNFGFKFILNFFLFNSSLRQFILFLKLFFLFLLYLIVVYSLCIHNKRYYASNFIHAIYILLIFSLSFLIMISIIWFQQTDMIVFLPITKFNIIYLNSFIHLFLFLC